MFIMYGKANCPFCDKAKELLEEKNLEYIYIDIGIEENAEELDYVKNRLQARSAPQIIHTAHGLRFVVGGYDDLVKYLRLL